MASAAKERSVAIKEEKRQRAILRWEDKRPRITAEKSTILGGLSKFGRKNVHPASSGPSSSYKDQFRIAKSIGRHAEKVGRQQEREEKEAVKRWQKKKPAIIGETGMATGRLTPLIASESPRMGLGGAIGKSVSRHERKLQKMRKITSPLTVGNGSDYVGLPSLLDPRAMEAKEASAALTLKEEKIQAALEDKQFKDTPVETLNKTEDKQTEVLEEIKDELKEQVKILEETKKGLEDEHKETKEHREKGGEGGGGGEAGEGKEDTGVSLVKKKM